MNEEQLKEATELAEAHWNSYVKKIVSAEVNGNYVEWEAMPFHSLRKTTKMEVEE